VTGACKACGKPCESEFCSTSCEAMHKNFGVTHKEQEDKKPIVRTRLIETTKDVMRKITSEKSLEDNLPWHLHKGECWHCFSWGDVDALTYLRHVMREQSIEYVALSTFAMAAADIHEIEEWLEKGYLKRIDFYVSENFAGTYKKEQDLLVEVASKCGGRCCIFKNHSKVMIAYGEKYDVCIETSANINTNPRCEQTVLTVSSELCDFYKDIFDGLVACNKQVQPKEWKPWKKNTENQF
jgi:hypothetical protein